MSLHIALHVYRVSYYIFHYMSYYMSSAFIFVCCFYYFGVVGARIPSRTQSGLLRTKVCAGRVCMCVYIYI